MNRQHTSLAILVGALLCIGIVGGADEPEKPSTAVKDVSEIRTAVRDLSRVLDDLLEDTVDSLSGKKEKTWYYKVESVLDRLERFEPSIKPDVARADLYRDFDEIDGKLEEVLKGLQAIKRKDRSWQRLLFKLRAANEELLCSIALGDPADKRVRQVLDRQIRLLTPACQQLEATARYVLADTPAAVVLLDNLRGLRRASDSLQERGSKADSLKDLLDNPAALTRAWEKVIQDFQRLAPRNSIYLLRSAGRVDRIHERIFRLMGMKGKCPVLIIRS